MHDNISQRPWQQKDRIQGYLFDGGMVLVNFIILGSLTQTPVAEMTDLRIGILLGIGIVTQISGALLKKAPLQQRLQSLATPQATHRENVLGCLSFIHFIFFLIVTAMTLALVGFIDLNESSNSRDLIWVLISSLVAVLTSSLVWSAIGNSNKRNEYKIRWRYQEIAANVLLLISASILTRFFWTALFVESEPPTYMGFSLRAFVLIAATSALFMVFYVPARLLFLAEDYKYPTTWLRLWLVAMFPLISIVLLGRAN